MVILTNLWEMGLWLYLESWRCIFIMKFLGKIVRYFKIGDNRMEGSVPEPFI